MRFSTASDRAKRTGLWFFLLWLRRPTRVGALVPSSKALATSMAARIKAEAPGVVVELGGGTGSITEAILATGTAPQDLVVVERETEMCAVLAERFPHIRILQGDAGDLKALLEQAGIGPVKTVVSGLPLLSMDNHTRQRIVTGVFSVLPPEGEYVQFTYGPVSPVSRQTRASLGIAGRRSDWVLFNLPPATVWRFRRDPAVVDAHAA